MKSKTTNRIESYRQNLIIYYNIGSSLSTHCEEYSLSKLKKAVKKLCEDERSKTSVVVEAIYFSGIRHTITESISRQKYQIYVDNPKNSYLPSVLRQKGKK